MFKHLGDKPMWVCQCCATTKPDDYRNEFNSLDNHACRRKGLKFVLEPIHFTMKEFRLWAVTQRISETVLNQQFAQFLKDQRKSQTMKLPSENAKAGKPKLQPKSSKPGPSKQKGKVISKDKKLTPLLVQIPITDKTVTSTGTKRSIQIRDHAVPVNYTDETPQFMKRKRTEPIAIKPQATSTPIVKGKGKAGRGLKAKNSKIIRPSPIRVPMKSSRLSVKTKQTMSSVIEVKTKLTDLTSYTDMMDKDDWLKSPSIILDYEEDLSPMIIDKTGVDKSVSLDESQTEQNRSPIVPEAKKSMRKIRKLTKRVQPKYVPITLPSGLDVDDSLMDEACTGELTTKAGETEQELPTPHVAKVTVPLKQISPNTLKKCAEAIEAISKMPPAIMDESSNDTVDYSTYCKLDSDAKIGSTKNPLNLLADTATNLCEPVVAETGNANDNNDIPKVELAGPSVGPQNDVTTYEQGEARNHQINLEHWAHYMPRLRSNQFLDVGPVREIIGVMYPSNEATYGWDALGNYMMRFPAVSRLSGQLIYVVTPHFTGSQTDILASCPELTPYQPVIEPRFETATILTGVLHEIRSVYRGPDPSIFSTHQPNAGILGGAHYASNPSTCCCNQMNQPIARR